MTRWQRIRVREGLRWVFRGVQFDKLEAEIDRMAAPLALGTIPEGRAAVLRRRIKHAISWLPPERGAKFKDMMARIGHSVGGD